MSKSTSYAEYVFKRHASIGAADAEDDGKFLKECFIDTGDFDTLRDCNDPRRIIIGRTGVGKSALLRHLFESEDHVIELPPETLSLNYISNSDILRFFENAGVKLDIFYQLLWRHVFTVELLKSKFKITNEASNKSFGFRLSNLFSKNNGKKKGLEYLKQWGEHFWEETEYRIKEFTTKLETDLKSQLGTSFSGVKLDASAAEKLTAEQKNEVINKAQKVVNSVQIKDLSEVIKLLAEDIFVDPQEKFFITIDRLDEDWADESIRYKLIRALIESIRSFQKIGAVKIIITLRIDLLERVYMATRDSGFQEEKYESLYLPIRWSKEQLHQLLDKRIEALIKEQYTNKVVKLNNIIPKRLGSKPSIDYIFDRTFLRPRDVILFLNTCLEKAEGKAILALKDISSAESEYSAKRLRSLQDEWGAVYPALSIYTKILEKKDFHFRNKSITEEQIDEFAINITSDQKFKADPLFTEAQKYIDNPKSLSSLRSQVFRTLYKLGVIGIKTDSHTPIRWSYLNENTIHEGELKPNSMIYIHPTFWRILGVKAEPLRTDIEEIPS